MHKRRFKLPRLCLSTILIEIGIVCALIAVNTRPLSYGLGEFTFVLTDPTLETDVTTSPRSSDPSKQDSGPDAQVSDEVAVDVQYTFRGNANLNRYTDHDNDWSPRVANYGWPFSSIEITTRANEIHHVHKQRLAANIAIGLAIIVVSTIAIEWSIRFANRARKPIASID